MPFSLVDQLDLEFLKAAILAARGQNNQEPKEYRQQEEEENQRGERNRSDGADGAPPGTSPNTTLFPRFNIFGNDPDSIQSTIPTSFPGGRDLVDVSVEEAEAAVAANFTPEERAAWEAAIAENIGNLTGDDPDLTGVDPDLEGTAAADDLQIQNILNQATEFTAGANGFAAVFEELEELEENLGDIEKEYVKRLQNELLRGGGVGWEFNPKDGDSIFFKLPVVIPGMSGIMKIKIKNPDGTFKTAGEIAAETGTQIRGAVDEVVALPGKLMEQAGEILGQSGELAEILAGTSDKTIEEALGDIFGGIFGAEGETDTSGIWDILIGQLTQETIDNESIEGGLLAGVGLPTVPTGDRSDDTVTSPFPEPTEGEPKVAPTVEEPDVVEPDVVEPDVVEPVVVEPVVVEPVVVEPPPPVDPVVVEPVVVEPPPPPPPTSGGGGGGGDGFTSGRVIGEAPMLQLPAFRPVMPQQKDYTVALNNIIQESLFEGMI
jgi:hypothetical protein